MKKIFNTLFSMQLTVALILMFAVSAAIATFIENDFGTTAAKVAIYNATWFEILLLLLVINLSGSLIVNKIWQRKKYSMFLFHISFIVIFIGAAITRYYGFEGMMHIREGGTSNQITSGKSYISVIFEKGGKEFVSRKAVLFSGNGNKKPGLSVNTGETTINIQTIDFVPNAGMSISKLPNGYPVASIVMATETGRESIVLRQNETISSGDINIAFDNPENESAVQINLDGGKLFITAPTEIVITNMEMTINDTIAAGEKVEFTTEQLYSFGGKMIILRKFEESAAITPVNTGKANGTDALVFEVTGGGETNEAIVWGSKGLIGEYKSVSVGGQTIRVSYGSKPIFLPFAIRLNDFVLDRYPGTNSHSSYASEVTLIDGRDNHQFDFRIYMNHILNYDGYRFYQSYYDQDEMGTILSVNHDGLGTIISYIGYALMSAGMLLSLISRRTRFRNVLRMIGKTRKKRTSMLATLFFIALAVPAIAFAKPQKREVNGVMVNVVDKAHAEEFGRLIVLGTNGRLEPMNTLSSKILRKFSGNNKLAGLNSDQVLIGIISQPEVWVNVPIIKVKNTQLRKLLNIKGKYASFSDFFGHGQGNKYLLTQYVEKAYNKQVKEKTRFDKKVISVDEKVNIFYMLYSGNFLKLFPGTSDSGGQWFSPNDEITGLPEDDSLFVKNIMLMYGENLMDAYQTGNFTSSAKMIESIATYQNNFAGGLLPSPQKTNIEILYNKADIFERLFKYYGLLGIFFLLILFLNLVFPKLKIGILTKTIIGILLVLFILQTLGLAARWYFSGHAPMSNGFESMIFVSWANMLAGFLLVRKSNIALAATTVLASLTLFVAHLNWMNPEVTNLVPVLKSIWLTIHVAVIISSYAFLGLGMMLGLFNLLLMIFQNKKNLERFNLAIKEISLTSEATLTIGLYMLTIGTFLGGVWANESWGRYWGWDPKETWALVTVLVYAAIIHLNFIPGLVGRYLFNAMSVVGFSSVLMTYFGVNYYLSGLHSYAAGDPVPIPAFVYYTIAMLALILIFAYINNFKINQMMKEGKLA